MSDILTIIGLSIAWAFIAFVLIGFIAWLTVLPSVGLLWLLGALS